MTNQITVGTWFYRITPTTKRLHKINYIAHSCFEWGTKGKTRCGWGFIADLTINPNKKSTIKFVKDERTPIKLYGCPECGSELTPVEVKKEKGECRFCGNNKLEVLQ